MNVDKKSEYIVKAKDVYLYKDTKKAQLIIAGLICIFAIYILLQFLNNGWDTIGIIIFVLLIFISLILAKMKNSILIEDRIIYIEKFLNKYEIDYNDLIRVKKQVETYTDSQGKFREAIYLVIEYLCDNKIKIIKDSFGLSGVEIDSLCQNFITNKQMDLLNIINTDDNLRKIDDINKEYFNIQRDIDIDTLEDTVYDYHKKQKNLKIIIVVIGIIIFISMFVIAKINRII